MEKIITYYLIRERLLGKKEEEGQTVGCFLFRNGKWELDDRNTVMDHLHGYEPLEPEGSPYGYGGGSMMDIDEISEEEAVKVMNRQILDLLITKWNGEFREEKEEWDRHPGWPSKYVETIFILNGVKLSLLPKDLGYTDNCWDQGFMETIQGRMKKDLEEYGATGILNIGFID